MNKNQFAEVLVKIAKELVGEDYHEYFKKKLDKKKVKSPTELNNEEKKDFFEDVDNGWTSKKEKKAKNIKSAVKNVSDIMDEFDEIHDTIIEMNDEKERLEREKWQMIKSSTFVKDFRDLALAMEKEMHKTFANLEKKGIIVKKDQSINKYDDTYLHASAFLYTEKGKYGFTGEFGHISFSMILKNYGRDSYSNEKLEPKIDGNMFTWSRNEEDPFKIKKEIDENNTLGAWKLFLKNVEKEMVLPSSKNANKKASSFNVNKMLKHYLIAALWSSTDDDGEPLDSNYDLNDLDSSVIRKSKKDCTDFVRAAEKEYGDDFTSLDEKQVGHDFWLTRNGHGAGFWDGDYDEELQMGDTFTDMSRGFGEVNLYVGDDDKIYII